MKITPDYLQQIIQEETNILLFEKRLGRELTTEEIEKLHELIGMRGSKRAAKKAIEKEMEKIRAGESDEERAAADARQKKYDEEGEQSFPESPTQQSTQDAANPPEEPAQQGDEPAQADPPGEASPEELQALQTDLDRQEWEKRQAAEKEYQERLSQERLQKKRKIAGSPKSKPKSASEIINKLEKGQKYKPRTKLYLMATFHDVPELANRPEMAAFKKAHSESERAYIDKHGLDLTFGDAAKKEEEARAAFFIDRYKDKADLKEYLLPLITQVLKESVK